MNRILFTHSYFLRFDPKQWQIMQPYAPLGTIAAAAVLREAGYQTFLWDATFAISADELIPSLNSVQPDILVIYDDGFNYLTKMCLTNMREAAFRMISLAKEKNIPVIVCSSDGADHYDKYLDNGATSIIKGEGEITLLEVINSLKNNSSDLSSIDGLVFRKENKTVINKPREVLKNLDALPLPAWDLVDINRYKKAWLNKHGYFSINMNTTRGCPFKCNWCAKPIYGNRYNSRSPENVIGELLWLIENYRPDHIWFCDDIFGLKPGWMNRFAELIKENGIQIKYKIQSRVDLLLEENIIEKLSVSGCDTAWVGAESGSQTVLDAMDKGTQVAQIYEATALLKKHNIKPAFFLQFGYPGETSDDIMKTIEMVKTLLPDDIGISISYPLPGTGFHDKVKNQLQNKSNWTDSDELALMFTNTYPPQFYKHLHKYVHKTYRIHQGKALLKNLFSSGAKHSLVSWKRIAGIIFHQPGKYFHQSRMNRYAETKPHEHADNNSPDSVQKAFDDQADTYDNNFTHTESGKIQRKTVHRFLNKKIDPVAYNKILEINCGTGSDAIWLAERGFNVLATDISQEMINYATKKIPAKGNYPAPVFKTHDFNRLSELNENRFDIIFSNFGGLNCADPSQIRNIAMEASQKLRPGGKFIAVVMGRKCVIENLYFLFRNKKLVNRRKSANAVSATVSDKTFPIWYYSPGEFSELTQPWLSNPVYEPVGLFTPPSYLNRLFSASKILTSGAAMLEKLSPYLPGFSDYADHYLVALTKR